MKVKVYMNIALKIIHIQKVIVHRIIRKIKMTKKRKKQSINKI